MTLTTDSTRRQFALSDLHPEARRAFLQLTQRLVRRNETEKAKLLLYPFEGYRSPQRQAHLLTTGATKAGPWHSAHQYGLAVDFAWKDPDWSWDLSRNNVEAFHHLVRQVKGLDVPITWDPLHVEHEAFAAMRTRVAFR